MWTVFGPIFMWTVFGPMKGWLTETKAHSVQNKYPLTQLDTVCAPLQKERTCTKARQFVVEVDASDTEVGARWAPRTVSCILTPLSANVSTKLNETTTLWTTNSWPWCQRYSSVGECIWAFHRPDRSQKLNLPSSVGQSDLTPERQGGLCFISPEHPVRPRGLSARGSAVGPFFPVSVSSWGDPHSAIPSSAICHRLPCVRPGKVVQPWSNPLPVVFLLLGPLA